MSETKEKWVMTQNHTCQYQSLNSFFSFSTFPPGSNPTASKRESESLSIFLLHFIAFWLSFHHVKPISFRLFFFLLSFFFRSLRNVLNARREVCFTWQPRISKIPFILLARVMRTEKRASSKKWPKLNRRKINFEFYTNKNFFFFSLLVLIIGKRISSIISVFFEKYIHNLLT